jgi:hypothetical protein
LTGIQSSTSAGTITIDRPAKQVFTSSASERRYGKAKSFPIPVWNGIIEHKNEIGIAVWEFLWCLDRLTSEKNGVGRVRGGAPIKIRDIAADLQTCESTVRRNLSCLVKGKYILCRRTSYGLVIEVLNSCKFGIWSPHPRSRKSERSGQQRSRKSGDEMAQKCAERSRKSARYKEDAVRNAAQNAAEAPAVPAVPATDVPNLEERVFASYRKAGVVGQAWRSSEQNHLRLLAERNESSKILAALEVFLQDQADYLKENCFPFSVFATQFKSYCERLAKNPGDDDVKSVSDGIEEEVEQEMCVEVEILTGPRAGRRDKAIPDTALLWESNGYARIIGPTAAKRKHLRIIDRSAESLQLIETNGPKRYKFRENELNNLVDKGIFELDLGEENVTV